MKKLVLILSCFVSSLVWANDSAGLIAAKAWLKMIDAGQYGQSWQQSDSAFKSQLTENKWAQALQGVRAPLGQIKSRSKLSAQAYSSLPGVPDGEYLVIQFQTEFQNKASATETLTLSKGSGNWLPVGYFIK
ncbi:MULTISPECIES: DUF4019 domain-containing protein [Pseudoalteromonas]|nr:MULTISPECIES: DUF4019 domain-containing protein [Pseudoalteromonas]